MQTGLSAPTNKRKFNMFEIVNTRNLKPNYRFKEQALLLKIRFQLLMYQRSARPTTAKHLTASIQAMNDHLNSALVSPWFREMFIDTASFYAGYFWHVNYSGGRYHLDIDIKPIIDAMPKGSHLKAVK